MRYLYPSVSLTTLCRLFGISRQAYYIFIKRSMRNKLRDEQILELVKLIRRVHPRMGVRKIHEIIKPELEKCKIKIGRDAMFNLLSDNQLLVRKRKRKIKTTNSYHRYHKYKNLVKDFTPYKCNQLWVSDLTYIRMDGGFSFLFLITDAYSKKIVGYHLSQNMETSHAIKALEMAVFNSDRIEGIIHHSDRGVQYCSNEYVKLCQDYGITLSMTEDGNPLDNPIAERVNGILKDEYLYEYRFADYQDALKKVDSTIYKYNQLRPHLSCNMKTPNQAHFKVGQLTKRWKNYYIKNQQNH